MINFKSTNKYQINYMGKEHTMFLVEAPLDLIYRQIDNGALKQANIDNKDYSVISIETFCIFRNPDDLVANSVNRNFGILVKNKGG